MDLASRWLGRSAVPGVALAVAYVLVARLGLGLTAPHPEVTLAWLPAGLGLGAALLLGARVWPWIAAGALASGLQAGLPALAAIATASGETAAALAGMALARDVGRLDLRMQRVRDVLVLVLLGVVPAAALGATVAAASLGLSGAAPWSQAGHLWLEWGLGSALSSLVLAPLLLAWAPRRGPRPRARSRPWRVTAMAGVVALACAGAAVSFSDAHGHVLRPYLLFPVGFLAAFWLGSRGATITTLIASVGAVWAAVRGVGSFASAGAPHLALLTSGLFVVALAVSTLGLAAVVASRTRADRALAARTARLEAVRLAAREMAAQPDLDRLLGAIARQAVALTGAPAGAIFLLDRSGRRFVPRAWQGFGGWMGALRIDRESGLGGLALAQRRGLRIDDYRAHPLAQPALVGEGGVTAVAVEPLLYQGRELGTIFVARQTPGATFTEGDQEALALLADMAAVAVATAEAVQARAADSERRYQLLAEHVRDVIWTCDTSLRWTYVSPSIEALRGYTVEEAMGHSLEAALTEASRQVALRALGDAVSRAEAPAGDRFWPSPIELELTRRDGSTVWTETTVTYLRDAAGRLEGFLGVTRDIDERKRAEQRLAAAWQRLELISRATHDVVWERDLAAGTIAWGERLRELLGGESGPGATDVAWWEDRVHPEDRPRVLAALQAALGGETGAWDAEYRFRRADGAWAHVMDRGLVVRGDGGRPLRMVGAMVDRTRHRMLEELVRLQAAALEASADAIVITDRQGVIQWVNPAFTELTGYASAEAVGQTPRLLRSGRHGPGFYAEIWNTILDGRPWRGRLVNRRKDGALYDEEQTITPVRDATGAIVAFIAVKQDVTERLRTEQALAQQERLARQREKLAEMGQLLAGVAHELNNPLSVVLGYAGLLQRTATTERLQAVAGKMDEAARRCARIVKNFLALARQYPPEKTTVSLNALVSEALELVAYPLRVDDVQVRVELDDALPQILADPHQLQQVILNLLSNATYALREARGPRRLTLATGHVGLEGPVWLEVRDTGPGLPEVVRERLFQPFVTTKPVGEGTGLGLSICKGIVEAHGGTIGAWSVAGEGTTFRIELPLGTAAPAREAGLAPESGPRAPLSVLVVDDEPSIVALLSDLLGADGHRVSTAENGATALQRLMVEPFDAVLCDLRMPLMDGPELYEILRRELPHLASRIAFLTGDTLASRTDRFLAEAGCPVLAKPFQAADIRRVLDQLAATGAGR